MKKTLILGLLGLAATAVTAYGQGTLVLDNYNTSGPYVTYGGPGVPANGVSGTAGTVGADIIGNPTGTSPWTVGLYYVLGNVTIGADPGTTPTGDPSTFTGGLVLGTGSGATAGINDVHTPAFPGSFLATADYAVPGTAAGGGNVVTMMLVAYNGATYDSSTYRGHSAAFQLTTTANTLLVASQVGKDMASFGVYATPEPSVLALSGIGAAALMLIRRKK